MVNKPSQQDVPAFYSPLTHDQHAQLGRIAILWGQADMFVDNLLTAVLGIAPELRARLFNDKTMGSKIDVLAGFVREMETGAEKTAILSFLALLDANKSQRNECFHGVWGFWISSRGKVEAAAQHHRQKGRPFKASDLPKLERALCRISYQGKIALAALGECEATDGADPLHHGNLRKALERFLTQPDEDRRNPDRRWKPGRLPWLTNPLE